MKKRHLELLFVTWTDSETAIGWDSYVDSPLELNYSVGFFVLQDEEKLVLSADYDHANDHSNRRIIIPRACIKRVRTVTLIPLPTPIK